MGKAKNAGEKPWIQLKTPSRKGTSLLCSRVTILAAIFFVLLCSDLDSLVRSLSKNFETVKNQGSLDRGELASCQGKRIYMYDLPPVFNVDVFNPSRCNHSLVPAEDICSYYINRGYGLKLSDLSLSSSPDEAAASGNASGVLFDQSDFYSTDSYALEVIFHERLQKYRCLTSQAELADAFFIPFYSGLLMLDFLYGSQRTSYEKRASYGLELMSWLETNGGHHWRKVGGTDHFLIMGRTTWDFRLKESWGTGFSALPYVSNMTHLVLETQWNVKNEQAIPYPTTFHPHSPERLRSWIENVKTTPRKYLFSYSGRPHNRNIRGLLASHCINAGPSVCNLIDCAVTNCRYNPIPVYTSFLQSNFCLEPIGDTQTRRSTFDCLIAGAIPVFFSKSSAYTQYTWHLPDDPISYSVYIAEEEINQGKSIQAILMSYSEERIQQMRRTITSMIPNLLYNDYENDDQSGAPKDAFEVSIEKVLDRIANSQRRTRCSIIGGDGLCLATGIVS